MSLVRREELSSWTLRDDSLGALWGQDWSHTQGEQEGTNG